jgi:hypothetical protein
LIKLVEIWKNHILTSMKVEYLTEVLEYDHRAGALAIKLLVEANEIGETYLVKAAFIRLTSSKFSKEMLASGIDNPETNESTYKELRRLIKAYPGITSGKTFTDWARGEYSVAFDMALRLIKKHWPGFEIFRISDDLPS